MKGFNLHEGFYVMEEEERLKMMCKTPSGSTEMESEGEYFFLDYDEQEQKQQKSIMKMDEDEQEQQQKPTEKVKDNEQEEHKPGKTTPTTTRSQKVLRFFTHVEEESEKMYNLLCTPKYYRMVVLVYVVVCVLLCSYLYMKLEAPGVRLNSVRGLDKVINHMAMTTQSLHTDLEQVKTRCAFLEGELEKLSKEKSIIHSVYDNLTTKSRSILYEIQASAKEIVRKSMKRLPGQEEKQA